MKTIGDSLAFVDIVGIKLGMTPQQAFTAVKAFNPNLKIDIINARLEPGDAPGTFKRVPQFAVAHTVGKQSNPLSPIPFTLADSSADVIALEFTTPPTPPMVGKITREVTFSQPVVASNLMDALRKKYGHDNYTNGSGLVWVFDSSSGKLLARRLTSAERSCVPGSPFDGFGFNGGGMMPGPGSLLNDSPTPINLTSFMAGLSPERGLICAPFIIAMNYGLGEGTSPDLKMPNMILTIQSPALLYASTKNTHDWLQSQFDSRKKKEDEDAQRRAAPKL